MSEIEQLLRFFRTRDIFAGKALILMKAVALERADADDMMAVYAASEHFGEITVKFHAWDYRHRTVAVIYHVVNAVIGQRHEIITMIGVLGDDGFRRASAVRTSCVAVQRALEHAVSGGFECVLSFHFCAPFLVDKGEKSVFSGPRTRPYFSASNARISSSSTSMSSMKWRSSLEKTLSSQQRERRFIGTPILFM